MDELTTRRNRQRDKAEAWFATEYAWLPWAERRIVREYLEGLHAAAVRREQRRRPAPVLPLRGDLPEPTEQ